MWVTREKAEWKSGKRLVGVSAHVGYQKESRVEVGRETGRCFCPLGLPEKKQKWKRGEKQLDVFAHVGYHAETGERDR